METTAYVPPHLSPLPNGEDFSRTNPRVPSAVIPDFHRGKHRLGIWSGEARANMNQLRGRTLQTVRNILK